MEDLSEGEQDLLEILIEEYRPYQQRKLPVSAAAARFPGAKQDVSEFNIAIRGLIDKGYIFQEDIQVVLTDKALGIVEEDSPSSDTDET